MGGGCVLYMHAPSRIMRTIYIALIAVVTGTSSNDGGAYESLLKEQVGIMIDMNTVYKDSEILFKGYLSDVLSQPSMIIPEVVEKKGGKKQQQPQQQKSTSTVTSKRSIFAPLVDEISESLSEIENFQEPISHMAPSMDDGNGGQSFVYTNQHRIAAVISMTFIGSNIRGEIEKILKKISQFNIVASTLGGTTDSVWQLTLTLQEQLTELRKRWARLGIRNKILESRLIENKDEMMPLF